jgi:hypothetical protein
VRRELKARARVKRFATQSTADSALWTIRVTDRRARILLAAGAVLAIVLLPILLALPVCKAAVEIVVLARSVRFQVRQSRGLQLSGLPSIQKVRIQDPETVEVDGPCTPSTRSLDSIAFSVFEDPTRCIALSDLDLLSGDELELTVAGDTYGIEQTRGAAKAPVTFEIASADTRPLRVLTNPPGSPCKVSGRRVHFSGATGLRMEAQARSVSDRMLIASDVAIHSIGFDQTVSQDVAGNLIRFKESTVQHATIHFTETTAKPSATINASTVLHIAPALLSIAQLKSGASGITVLLRGTVSDVQLDSNGSSLMPSRLSVLQGSNRLMGWWVVTAYLVGLGLAIGKLVGILKVAS